MSRALRKSSESGQAENRNAGVHDVLNEALTRVARLEAALAVTGGTVHDVNNLLTVLSGNLYMLTELVRDQKALFEKSRNARNTAEKCCALMRELLTFARDTDKKGEIICPANHIAALKPLLQRGMPKGHRLESFLSCDPWSVAASSAQFESAITNLILNARDALGTTGSINVHVDNIVVETEGAAKLKLSEGEYICVRILDNGAGIPKDVLPRVFEPLFTTKKKGTGTGLGLSMVQRFAGKNQGALTVKSIEGRGTEVRLWLPRSDQKAEVTANMTLPLSTLTGGDETAILITNDEDVRAAIQDILQALGYRVIVASLGQPPGEILPNDASPVILISERTLERFGFEQSWIQAVMQHAPNVRHVAILAPDADALTVAPDADVHLFRPIAIVELARAMRAAAEIQK